MPYYTVYVWDRVRVRVKHLTAQRPKTAQSPEPRAHIGLQVCRPQLQLVELGDRLGDCCWEVGARTVRLEQNGVNVKLKSVFFSSDSR